MHRRNFIKQGCTLCLAAGSTAFIASLLESCTPLPIYRTEAADKKMIVPLTAFSNNNFLIVKPANLSFDVAVIKDGDDYRSMIMLCTHADNPLRFNGNEFKCNLHGSMFDRLGRVEKGPAEKSLATLSTKIENGNLVIGI